MKVRSLALVALVALLIGSSACGIGVQGGAHSTSYSANDILTGDGTTHSATFTSFGVTVYDKTGLLLAGAASAGSQYNAQQQAEQNAIDRGGKAGDTYSYEYTQYAPVPGNWTYFSYDKGTADLEGANDLTYFNFEMRTKLGNWKAMNGKMRISIPLGMVWTEYQGDGADITWIGMPVGIDVGYTISSKLTASGRALIDPLIGGLTYAIGGDGGWVELGGRSDFRPFKMIGLFADAMYRRTPELTSSDAGIANEFRAQLGVAFIFGEGSVLDKAMSKGK